MTTTPAPQIAEVVTFRLNDGVSDADYLALNEASKDHISALPGFVSRQLSKSDDGVWTDYTLWASAEAAQAHMESFMSQDFAPALVGAINAETMRMRHQKILG